MAGVVPSSAHLLPQLHSYRSIWEAKGIASVTKTDDDTPTPAVANTKGICSPATMAGSGMHPRVAGGGSPMALTTGTAGSTSNIYMFMHLALHAPD